MRRAYLIEWPDEFGFGWLNKDNLEELMRTKRFIGAGVEIKVTEIIKVDEEKRNE